MGRSKKRNRVQILAHWLNIAANETGQIEEVRKLIRHAVNASLEMYPVDGHQDPKWGLDDEVPTVLAEFAAFWDQFDKQAGG